MAGADPQVLSNAEIAAATIDPDVARTALDRVERRLADLLDIRKTLETKQAGLFSAYIGFAMAICAIGAALAQKPEFASVAGRVFLAATPFGLGACVFLAGLWPTVSGLLGASPNDWLRRGQIDGAHSAMPLMLAYEVSHMRVAIAAAQKDNSRKQAALMAGLLLGLVGMAGVAAMLRLTFLA